MHPLRKPVLRIGYEETEFDFAVANGKAVQLVRCWSFQGADQERLSEEVRAWAWTVRSMRLAGDKLLRSTGEIAPSLQAKEKVLDLAPKVEVDALFIPPETGQSETQAFEVALLAFADKDTSIKATPVERVDELARRGLTLLTGA
jgi:hypothetical protein